MSDTNKAHCMRIYDEVFNEGKLNVADEVIAADAIDHSPPPGSTGDTRDDLKEFARTFRDAFPDARFTVREMIAEGELVAAYATFEGTHQGEFMGVPPTGRRVSMEFMDLIRSLMGNVPSTGGSATSRP